MSALAARRARLLASLYSTTVGFGEPATWTPGGGGASVSVTIRRAPADEIAAFGESRAVVDSLMILVRASDLGNPAQGDQVLINPDTTPEFVQIIAQPRRERFNSEWLCEAARV